MRWLLVFPSPLYWLDFKNLNDLKEVADAQIEKCSLVTDFDVLCPTTVLQETQDRCHRGRHLGDGMARLILEQMTYRVIVRI